MGAMQKDVPEAAAAIVGLIQLMQEHERLFVFARIDDYFCRKCGKKRIPKGKACEDCWEQQS